MFYCRRLRLQGHGSSILPSRTPVRCIGPLLRRYNVTKSTDKPYYVTTPIFYPNARPHIGHLHSLVTADIIARFQRILNPSRPVVFLTGTDEHGLKMQQAAQAQGVPPLEWCDRMSTEFRKLSEKANISQTMFMRTTQPGHRVTVEHVWNTLAAQGLIYKDTYEGYYSTVDECFYPLSRVSGHPTKPNVKISTETGSPVELSKEVNYKFRLSQFRDTLLEHYSTAAELNAKAEDGLVSRGVYPDTYQSAVIQQLKTEPLEDLSISRPRDRIEWGVPVPGDESQTVYVWFDALLVYLSGVGYPSSNELIWPPDVQVVGKDIIRFHAIHLPAILHALGLPMPKTLLTHAHWTAGQKKMSKSLGNVADPIKAMDDFGVDAVRFYLARVGGRWRNDVDWSQAQLKKYAGEIRNALGNYFLRVTSKTIKRRAASAILSLPQESTSLEELSFSDELLEGQSFRELFSRRFRKLDLASTWTTPEDLEVIKVRTNEELLALVDGLGGRVAALMRNLEVAEALHAIVLILGHANGVISTLEPWLAAHPPDVALSSYLTSLEMLRITGILLQPFIPQTSEKLLDALCVPVEERSVEYARVGKGTIGRRALALDVEGVVLLEKPAQTT